MGDYSETGDTRLIMRGAGQLGVDWDDDTVHAIAEALEAIEQAIGMGGASAAGAAPRLRMLRPVPMSKPSRSDSPR